MLTREMDAGGKWCPMVRVVHAADTGAGQALTASNDIEPRTGNDARCIGARCMMWRWFNPDEVKLKTHVCENTIASEEPARPADVPASWQFCAFDKAEPDSPACWVEPVAEAMTRMRGYCGMAGDPVDVKREVWVRDANAR